MENYDIQKATGLDTPAIQIFDNSRKLFPKIDDVFLLQTNLMTKKVPQLCKNIDRCKKIWILNKKKRSSEPVFSGIITEVNLFLVDLMRLQFG